MAPTDKLPQDVIKRSMWHRCNSTNNLAHKEWFHFVQRKRDQTQTARHIATPSLITQTWIILIKVHYPCSTLSEIKLLRPLTFINCPEFLLAKGSEMVFLMDKFSTFSLYLFSATVAWKDCLRTVNLLCNNILFTNQISPTFKDI